MLFDNSIVSSVCDKSRFNFYFFRHHNLLSNLLIGLEKGGRKWNKMGVVMIEGENTLLSGLVTGLQRNMCSKVF